MVTNARITRRKTVVTLTSIWVIALAAVAGCDGIIDSDNPPSPGHGCTLLNTNDLWNDQNLKLHHTDSRACPYASEPGQWVYGGGTIEDRSETWPNTGNENSIAANLEVLNSIDYCVSAQGATVGSDSDTFGWVDFDDDGTNEWVAQLSAGYTARTGPDGLRDCPEFHVTLFDPFDEKASAWTRISYSDEL